MFPTRCNLLCKVAVLLLLYSLTLAILVGNIGFQGDDWWIFSFPVWNPFPDSVYDYAAVSKRPIEGLYWISMFEIFRFARLPYNFFSCLLLAGSCLALGACLLKAFPKRKPMAVMTVFFAFLLPPLSNLTYMIHTDNSRISSLLFWISVFLFQHWASKSRSWFGLSLPCVLSALAMFTYENITFLIFSVPGFVQPILGSAQKRVEHRTAPMVRLMVAISGVFTFFVVMRFLVFSGGAVSHRSLLPSFDLLRSYFSVLAAYLWAPFSNIPTNGWAVGWGLAVAVTAGGLILIWGHDEGVSADKDQIGWMPSHHRVHQGLYIVLLGVAVFLLGIFPYLLAGYGATFGFTSQSRIYSSGAYGVAIILAAALGIPGTSTKLKLVTRCAAITLMALMAVFFADLGSGWKEAAIKRNHLCASLVKQVPAVQPGTTFLFLDLQWYLSNRAVVFQGVDGLPEFIRILYGIKDLYAYFLYPPSNDLVDREGRVASVSPRGLVARGSLLRGPIPLDSLIIFRRRGSKLVLLDSIAEVDNEVAMDWNGVAVIKSNRNLISYSKRTHSQGASNAFRPKFPVGSCSGKDGRAETAASTIVDKKR